MNPLVEMLNGIKVGQQIDALERLDRAEFEHRFMNQFHTLKNFLIHHHSRANRQAHERKKLDEAILNFKENTMQMFNDAVANAKSRAQAEMSKRDEEISALKAAAAAVPAPMPAEGMILEADAVAAVDAILPSGPAV